MLPRDKIKNESIIKRHLILCEGIDEYYFLISMLNNPTWKDKKFFSSEIQVINFGGNEELAQQLQVLTRSHGFDDLSSLLIMRDAEKNAIAAEQQIQDALKKAGLEVPQKPGEWKAGKPQVGFLLFPYCDNSLREGTLEDLCLSILEESGNSEILKEIQVFVDMISRENGRSLPRKHKNKLHTYFSITDRLVGMKIGEAAKAGAFDWNSDRLSFFKSFLLDIKN